MSWKKAGSGSQWKCNEIHIRGIFWAHCDAHPVGFIGQNYTLLNIFLPLSHILEICWHGNSIFILKWSPGIIIDKCIIIVNMTKISLAHQDIHQYIMTLHSPLSTNNCQLLLISGCIYAMICHHVNRWDEFLTLHNISMPDIILDQRPLQIKLRQSRLHPTNASSFPHQSIKFICDCFTAFMYNTNTTRLAKILKKRHGHALVSNECAKRPVADCMTNL